MSSIEKEIEDLKEEISLLKNKINNLYETGNLVSDDEGENLDILKGELEKKEEELQKKMKQ